MISNTIGAKMFNDYKASKLFAEFYEGLSEDKKFVFGAAIRALFDKKIISDDLKEFYITERDVATIYDTIKK